MAYHDEMTFLFIANNCPLNHKVVVCHPMVVSINNSSSGVNAQNLFNSKYFRTEDYFTLINTVKHFIPLYEYTPSHAAQ